MFSIVSKPKWKPSIPLNAAHIFLQSSSFADKQLTGNKHAVLVHIIKSKSGDNQLNCYNFRRQTNFETFMTYIVTHTSEYQHLRTIDPKLFVPWIRVKKKSLQTEGHGEKDIQLKKRVKSVCGLAQGWKARYRVKWNARSWDTGHQF